MNHEMRGRINPSKVALFFQMIGIKQYQNRINPTLLFVCNKARCDASKKRQSKINPTAALVIKRLELR